MAQRRSTEAGKRHKRCNHWHCCFGAIYMLKCLNAVKPGPFHCVPARCFNCTFYIRRGGRKEIVDSIQVRVSKS